MGMPGKRSSIGSTFIDMIERDVMNLSSELFGCSNVICQFLSGMQANIAAYHAVLEPGDKVVSSPSKHGGHFSHHLHGPLELFKPEVLHAPFDPDTYNIDVGSLEALFEKENPKLLIVGWSGFPFAYPLKEIRKLCDAYDVRLLYDMSHVAGLVAGGVFQTDVGELADIITTSTGKSMHAPDHGLLFYNREEYEPKLVHAATQLLTSNAHPQELAAIGIALAELKAFGNEYATQVVKNTKTLGKALTARGVKALYADQGYSDSHTLLLEYENAESAVTVFDNAGIALNACELPWDEPGKRTGLRIGTQVVTRRGLGEIEMVRIADAIARILVQGENPAQIRYELVLPLARAFQGVAYSFDADFPLDPSWQDKPYQPAQAADVEALTLSVPAFADLSIGSVRKISHHMEHIVVRDGQLLFEEGAQPDAVYFVINGTLEVFTASGLVIAECEAGTHVGELGVMRSTGRAFPVRARGATSVLRLPAEFFMRLLLENEIVHAYFERYCTSLN
jgi:glycine hydroxymethyltransferase